MSESDIIQRLQKATLYAGHGELSDLPEEAADAITALRAKVKKLEGALNRMLLEFDFMVERGVIPDVRNDVIFVDARAALGDTHE